MRVQREEGKETSAITQVLRGKAPNRRDREAAYGSFNHSSATGTTEAPAAGGEVVKNGSRLQVQP